MRRLLQQSRHHENATNGQKPAHLHLLLTPPDVYPTQKSAAEVGWIVLLGHLRQPLHADVRPIPVSFCILPILP